MKKKLPVSINVYGANYKLQVALVNTYHDDGTPRNVTIIREQDKIELAGGEHFITLYTSSETAKHGKPSN